MMRRLNSLCLCLCIAGWAVAQDANDMGGYTHMRIDKVGRFKGGFEGSLSFKEMTDGVRITLLADDPDMKPLPIQSYSMRFEQKEGASAPSRITMEGGVKLTHPQGELSAEKAVWDFETGELVFTGDPVMNSETAQGVRGSKIAIDFKKNTINIFDMQADTIPLRAMEKEADPSLLVVADVSDWTGLIDALKVAANDSVPSPGKHLVDLLSEEVRVGLMSAETAVLVKQQKMLLKQLNKVLQNKAFYKEDAFAKTALSEQTKALVAKTALEPLELTQRNRLLLHDAFPGYITAGQ